MAKALKIAAVVVAVAGLALVTGGLAAGASLSFIMSAGTGIAGLTVGGLFTAATLLSTGASLLSPKPKVPETSAANSDRLTVSINTRAPRVTVVGTTAMATDLRDQEWSADQSYLHRFVVVASHRVAAVREIWFDDKLAWSIAGGVQGGFIGFLDVTPVLEGSPNNAINIGARMGSSRRYTGCAYVYLRYKLSKNGKTDSPFASSVPSRMTIVGDGAAFYDPRLDSTVPGGSGPMRADDQSTWAWNPSACRNPALAMLFYLLGWRIQNPATGAWKKAVGKGIPAARIDLASFITAANLCDETVARADGTTEPRYRCDGVWSEQDDTSLVLENLKATMNAVVDDVDGKIRVSVLHNDLGVPIGELTAADVQGAFTWTQTPALSDCVNVLRGGYTDASSVALYQLVDFPEARIPSPDGIDRAQTLNLPLVQSPSQAQRLVKTRLQRAQYPGSFQATFLSTAWRYQKGDVIEFSFYPLGWERKLFRIADMATQVDGLVPMLLREEHASIYAFDGTEVGAVQGAEPTHYDPALWPLVRSLAEVNDQVTAIISDGVLARGSEKRSVAIGYQQLVDQYASLDQRYQALGAPADVTPSRNAARDALTSLTDYLASLQPPWTDRTVDTPIAPADYEQRWKGAGAGIETFGAAITGRPGSDGLNGTNGTNGRDGANGVSSFVHLAYADSADGSVNFTTGAVGGRAFVGIYRDQVEADSTDYHAYTWSRLRGVDGTNGRDGTPGAPGADGRTPYTHFAYANSANGSADFSTDDPAGRAYLGVYTDYVVADSADYHAYAWSRIKGADGRDGVNGLPGAPGADGRSSYAHYAYANAYDGTVDFTIGSPDGRAWEGFYEDTVASDSTNPGAYVWRQYAGPSFGMASRGAVNVAGTVISKSTKGAIEWDSDAYSTVGYKNGAIARGCFSPGAFAMFGLNADPLTNQSYDTLDFAWYGEGNQCRQYESAQPLPIQFTGMDESYRFAVEYDGRLIRYTLNGNTYRTVDIGPGYTFYFDSSLNTPGCKISNIAFERVPEKGSGGVTLIADTAATEISGNNVRCTNNAGWGAGHFHSKESYAGGAVCSWTIPPDNSNLAGQCNTMAGLSAETDDGSHSFGHIDFAIHRNDAGQIALYSNGAILPAPSIQTIDPKTSTTQCRIHYDGANSVYYWVDGVNVFVQRVEKFGSQLCFAAAMASYNPRIYDVALSQAGTRGADGGNGLNGTNGTNGRDGANGVSSFVHLAYADSADGSVNFTTGAVGGRTFVGIYRDQVEADSADYHAYTWSRLRGVDGTNGRDGTPGIPGADGRTPYTHFAYATSADGSVNFSTDQPAGRTYLGVYTDYVVADSGDYRVYTWSLIKGADGANGQPGADAYSVTLSQSAIILRATADGTIKGGELPRTFGLKVMRGGADVTNGASVAMTSSDAAIAAGYGNGTVSLTGGAPGWLDVSVSYGGLALGTYRLTITVQRDAPSPASQTSAAQALYANTGSSAYDGSGASSSLLMKANGSGQITAGAFGEYYAEGGTGNYIMRYAGKLQYRAGGGSWADAQAEVTGTTATTRSTGDSTPGSISLSVTIGGLTAGTTYEVRAIYRKVSGAANVSGAINGDMSAQQ